jgi:pimeloyl-ACP methyl ester carboxylesterase
MPARSSLGLARFFIDASWAAGEYASKIAMEPVLRRLAPRARGPRAVLTLPGFGGPEISLNPLNAFLNRQGFRAEGWGLGTNRGPQTEESLVDLVERLRPRLERMADSTGAKVALVGQSLGGIYARELARALPDLIDRVITLGSPAYLRPDALEHMNVILPHAMRWMTGKRPEQHLSEQEAAILHSPPPVPLVAIFSAVDGVVDATTTAIPRGDLTFDGGLPRENIEVFASHLGMAVNPIILIAVCDRLVADPAAWKPFDARRYMLPGTAFAARLFYPEARDRARARAA